MMGYRLLRGQCVNVSIDLGGVGQCFLWHTYLCAWTGAPARPI